MWLSACGCVISNYNQNTQYSRFKREDGLDIVWSRIILTRL